MSRSVKLVRTATRPSRVRPNHVPPASASRPAKIWGWSSHQWHSRVDRAKNSSRFTARTIEHGARAAETAEGLATKRKATHMGPRSGPRAPRDGRPPSENTASRGPSTVNSVGVRPTDSTQTDSSPGPTRGRRTGEVQETTAPDHPSREYPRRFDRQDVFDGASPSPPLPPPPQTRAFSVPGGPLVPSHFSHFAPDLGSARGSCAGRRMTDSCPPPRPPRRLSTDSPPGGRANDRVPSPSPRPRSPAPVLTRPRAGSPLPSRVSNPSRMSTRSTPSSWSTSTRTRV